MIKKMSDAEYFAHPSLNMSSFKAFIKESELAFKHGLDNPFEGSPATVLGSMVHCLFLEPHLFEETFVRWELTKSLTAKKAVEAKALLDPGQSLYTDDMHKQAKGMVKCLKNFKLPHQSQREVAGFSTIKEVPVKAKLDWYDDEGWIWDLKTSSKLASFERVFKWAPYHYDLAAMWYLSVFSDLAPTGFKWLVVGTEEPYDYRIFTASKETLLAAQLDIVTAIEKYKFCLAKNEWAGYDKTPLEI